MKPLEELKKKNKELQESLVKLSEDIHILNQQISSLYDTEDIKSGLIPDKEMNVIYI